MKLLPAAQQAGIGDIAHQRVLEQVGGLRRRAALKHKTGVGQAAEGVGQFGLAAPGDRRQQLIREVAADYGADLRDFARHRADAGRAAPSTSACDAAGTPAAAGERALPEALAAKIVERADGVPLFVEELARAVIEAQGSREGVECALSATALAAMAAAPHARSSGRAVRASLGRSSLGGLDALTVDDRGGGAGVAPDPFAVCHHERVVYPLKAPVVAPG